MSETGTDAPLYNLSLEQSILRLHKMSYISLLTCPCSFPLHQRVASQLWQICKDAENNIEAAVKRAHIL